MCASHAKPHSRSCPNQTGLLASMLGVFVRHTGRRATARRRQLRVIPRQRRNRESSPVCEAQKKLRRAQRRVARRRKRSNRWRKAVSLLGKIHQYIFNQRLDHQHKLARMLVNQYGFIAVEDLNVKGLAGGMLSKQVHDASWASFIAKLAYKAEEAGRQLVKVDPRGTSQRCPCGAKVPKKLSDREHVCTACGLITTRDQASAAEILRLGLSLQPVMVVQ